LACQRRAAALVLGRSFYVFTAARFDLCELITGHGDHRIAGGALAISALAAGHVTQAAAALGRFSGTVTDFGHAWTWVAFTGWLLALPGLFRHGWPVLRGQLRPAAAQHRT
jgi:hypothetical protein